MLNRAISRKEVIRKHLIRIVQVGHVGDKISSENELCKMFNVSRGTVRAAIKELVASNYMVARQGAGLFINRKSEPELPCKLIGVIAGNGRIAYYSYYVGTIMAGAIRQITKSGHNFILLENLLVSDNWIDELAQLNLDGMLWINPQIDYLKALAEKGVTTVALGSCSTGTFPHRQECEIWPTELSGVFIHLSEEGRRSVEHFIHQGFDKMLFHTEYPYNQDHLNPFFRGVTLAFKEHGLNPADNLRVIPSGQVDEVKFRDVLCQGFTGIYVLHTQLNWVNRILQNEGFSHGRNCCLLTRNSQPAFLYLEKNFDRIDTRLEFIGEEGAKMLLKRCENPNCEPVHIPVAPHIISTNHNEGKR